MSKANCLGSATIGGIALKEIGLQPLLVSGTRHAFLAFVTPDNRLYFNHFQGDGSKEVTKDDVDHVSIEDLVAFARSPDERARVVPLAIGSPLQWWGDIKKGLDHEQEVVYLNKDIEPALWSWLQERNANTEVTPPEHFMGHTNVIDPHVAGNNTERARAITRRSPHDSRALFRLMELEDPELLHSHPVADQWRHLTRVARYSEQGTPPLKLILRKIDTFLYEFFERKSKKK